YLQSGGAGAECDIIFFTVPVPYTGGNQPLTREDDLGIKFNRNPGSEANSYSGNIIIYKAELIYTANRMPTH
ncbi:MAG: hypothetical protein KAU50_00035, partial [Candidatus Marinimicrobia bacterium]|nr:hypothetical protein [Candidatus Neomarinimicrobiota bacterium]